MGRHPVTPALIQEKTRFVVRKRLHLVMRIQCESRAVEPVRSASPSQAFPTTRDRTLHGPQNRA
jgi:hypothetical protein